MYGTCGFSAAFWELRVLPTMVLLALGSFCHPPGAFSAAGSGTPLEFIVLGLLGEDF
jgi:hypothetical protein